MDCRVATLLAMTRFEVNQKFPRDVVMKNRYNVTVYAIECAE